MALILDWTPAGSAPRPGTYARLARNSMVTFSAYLHEQDEPIIPVGASQKSIAAVAGEPARANGIIRHEGVIAELRFYPTDADRRAGSAPVGGVRISIPSGRELDAVFEAVEADDHDGAVAAIYNAVKARIPAEPVLAAEFSNLRDA